MAWTLETTTAENWTAGAAITKVNNTPDSIATSNMSKTIYKGFNSNRCLEFSDGVASGSSAPAVILGPVESPAGDSVPTQTHPSKNLYRYWVFSCWINFTSTDERVVMSASKSPRLWRLYTKNQRIYFEHCDENESTSPTNIYTISSPSPASDGIAYNDGKWHNVIFAKEFYGAIKHGRLWVDGLLVTTTANDKDYPDEHDGDGHIMIGGEFDSFGDWVEEDTVFIGKIDDVAIWSDAVFNYGTVPALIYNGGKPNDLTLQNGDYNIQDKLVLYYTFEEDDVFTKSTHYGHDVTTFENKANMTLSAPDADPFNIGGISCYHGRIAGDNTQVLTFSNDTAGYNENQNQTLWSRET